MVLVGWGATEDGGVVAGVAVTQAAAYNGAVAHRVCCPIVVVALLVDTLRKEGTHSVDTEKGFVRCMETVERSWV